MSDHAGRDDLSLRLGLYPFDTRRGWRSPRRAGHPSEATAPGIVIKCDLLGALRVKQKDKGGATLRNDRYIFCPRKEDAEDEPVAADHVPEHLRREIEQFFRSSVSETGKEIRFKGWQDAKAARK